MASKSPEILNRNQDLRRRRRLDKPIDGAMGPQSGLASLSAAAPGEAEYSASEAGGIELELLKPALSSSHTTVIGSLTPSSSSPDFPSNTDDESLNPEAVLIRDFKSDSSGSDLGKKEETSWTIAWQVFLPFLVAGLGMVGAGLVLDVVQHWKVFQNVSEVFILVPALLGLKGNLEMTLASRLSTQANLGHLDEPGMRWGLIKGNLALVQCQAIVVGFLASIAAVVLGWVPDGIFEIDHALLLCASSLATASLASLVLGVIMILVILVSHRYRINPDNVATPIAASLGDLTTLALLSWIASMLFDSLSTQRWLPILIILFYVSLIPLCAWMANANPLIRPVLRNGWSPVLSAMMISSLGGFILDYTVATYKGIAVFQPVINGVGGNLVAVQASRISTWLHQNAKPGVLPSESDEDELEEDTGSQKACINPCAAFFASGGHARTARVLLMMVVPGHLIFAFAIRYLQAGHTSFTPVFLLTYLGAALLQVIMLLYVGHVMVLGMWRRRIDPDNSAIPYLTALGDLLGTALLAAAFHILFLIGDRDADVGD